MAMYKNYDDAFKDFIKIKNLDNKETFIKTFIWCLPNTDGRANGKPSKKQRETLKFKSAGIIEGEQKEQKNGVPSKQIIDEHIVPRTIIKTELLKLYDSPSFPDKDEFIKVASKAMDCLITKDEDKKINDAGIKQKMPEDESLKGNPWARYIKAEIAVYKKQDNGDFTKIDLYKETDLQK